MVGEMRTGIQAVEQDPVFERQVPAAKKGVLPENTATHAQEEHPRKNQRVPESQVIIYLLRVLHEPEIPFRIGLVNHSLRATITVKQPDKIQ